MEKILPQKKWVYAPKPDESAVKKLRAALNLSEITATLLLQRHIDTYEKALHFFRDTLADCHDPFLMSGMDVAVERLMAALENKEHLLFYGDYDVDGTTSVSLFMAFFAKHFPEASCTFYIPDRYAEGYGLSERGIEMALKQGVTLLITLDCGIRATEKIAYAKEKGIDVLVCDHHEPGDTLPDALAILDPKIVGNPYPFKSLSGCGVGFKLLQALCKRKGIADEALTPFLDFVAISTACDIVPMTGENRILVREGLKVINNQARTGIKALLKIVDLKQDITVSEMVFRIGPRINAAGRIAHANNAVRLLLCQDYTQALALAKSIDTKNELRKDYDQEITEEALKLIEENKAQTRANVLFKHDWHKGVIGIVASRCIEKDYKPTIILTESNGKATGSARSIRGFDIHCALSRCAHLLDTFGGHKFAAGLTLPLQNVEKFRTAFQEIACEQISENQLIPRQALDLQIDFNHINFRLHRLIAQMAPFGPENMRPVFGTEKVEIVGEIVVMKEIHLKITVKQTKHPETFTALGFRMIDFLPLLQENKYFRICYQLSLNRFRGQESLQLMLKDIQPMPPEC